MENEEFMQNPEIVENPEEDELEPTLDAAIASGMDKMILPEDIRTLTRLRDNEISAIAVELAVNKALGIKFPISMIKENLFLRISGKEGKGRNEVIEMVQAVKKEKEKRKKWWKLW